VIIRVFRATARAERRAEYERLIREDSVELLRAQSGMVSLEVGLPMPHSPDDFVMISVWKDMESLLAFTGPDWQTPVALPGESELVVRTAVDHYQRL
jgi:quinol monooxygenase YgiN